jgi:hypothetical protein
MIIYNKLPFLAYKNILITFLWFIFIIKKKKKEISHFKMPTLNSDVTVNSYNNLYLFQWNIFTEMTVFGNLQQFFAIPTSLIPSFKLITLLFLDGNIMSGVQHILIK